MALVKQPKTAVFRPKSKYEYIVHRLCCVNVLKKFLKTYE